MTQKTKLAYLRFDGTVPGRGGLASWRERGHGASAPSDLALKQIGTVEIAGPTASVGRVSCA